jgi:hypothetical protein
MPVGADARWRTLDLAGGAAALFTAVSFAIHITVVFPLWQARAFEGNIVDWFALFEDNSLIGLLSLDLLLVVDYVLLIPVFLALYVALKRTSASLAAMALSTGLVGIATYFAANSAFDMLVLSDKYAAASTDVERAALGAVGEAMVASVTHGTAYYLSYFLATVAYIAISVPMLWGEAFGKVAGYVGIVSSVASLAIYLRIGPVSYGGMMIGDYVSILSIVGFEVWYVLIALRLFGRGDPLGTGRRGGHKESGQDPHRPVHTSHLLRVGVT